METFSLRAVVHLTADVQAESMEAAFAKLEEAAIAPFRGRYPWPDGNGNRPVFHKAFAAAAPQESAR